MTRASFVLAGLFAVGVASVLVDASCSSTTNAPAPTDAGQEGNGDTLVLGVELALTGNLNPYGLPAQSGIAVAEHQINSLGGILGRQVKFQIVDDTSDVDAAGGVVSSFIEAGVAGMIGPSGSIQAPLVQSTAHAGKVAIISPSASTPVTRDAEACPDRYFFRTAASHGLQAKALALRSYRGFAGMAGDAGTDGEAGPVPDAGTGPEVTGCRQVAVIHTDDTYGDPIAQGISTELSALGGSVVFDAPVPTTVQGAMFYAGVVADLIAKKPDCQIVVSLTDVGDGYMRAFKTATMTDTSRDWSTFVSVGSNGLAASAFLINGRDNPQDPASPTVGEGMYIMNLDLNPATPEHQEFVNLYNLSFPLDAGQDPPGYAGNAYDAAILIALAIEYAGTATDTQKIRDALYIVSSPPGTAYSPGNLVGAFEDVVAGKDIDYNGASGPVDFDECGEVISGFVMSKVVSGQYQAIPSDLITVDDLK
jgi:branched-chain amino acid transport system substrate-binding protein